MKRPEQAQDQSVGSPLCPAVGRQSEIFIHIQLLPLEDAREGFWLRVVR